MHAVLERLEAALPDVPRALLLAEVRAVLAEIRLAPADIPDAAALAGQVAGRIAALRSPSLVPVINATGVVLHTNLGRAPLGDWTPISGYSNLEYDLDAGRRGRRDQHMRPLLDRLFGASAMVVNNGAAALFLALHELARGGEVIVSRGELIEIGDGFRIPEIMEHAGALLREVGATNRTRIEDYRAAITPNTRLLLSVHPSNFHISGFTARPALGELAELGREAGIPVMQDLGSGCLVDLKSAGIVEPLVSESLNSGVGVVSFSGDKLLGGPQAGFLVGSRELLERIRRNPVYRALRLDKLMIQALETTLRRLLFEQWEQIPALRMIRLSADCIRARAAALAGHLPGALVEDGESVIGGGSTPDQSVPTYLLLLKVANAARAEAALRAGKPPVIARVANDRIVIDLRTVAEEEEPALLAALQRLS